MNEDTQEVTQPNTSGRPSLVERLDPALGEASSGIGVLLSEFVRRTLRGGVAKIEEEIDGLVDEKVDLTVSNRMPAFEEAATKTAESKARIVAGEAVDQVRKEVNESSEKLEQQIVDTREEAEKSIISTSEKLTSDISSTEQRARDLVNNQITDLAQKSQKTYLNVLEKLDALTNQSSGLAQQLSQESSAKQSQIEELRQANLQLASRLAELEKPKGLKGLWNKMFGKKKPAIEAPMLEGRVVENPDQDPQAG